jgi:hypothetical protein
MSKKNEKAAAEQPEETLEMQAGVDIGRAAQGAEFEAVDPNENIPHFVPGQNWKVGQTLAGKFLRIEARYSTAEKKPNWTPAPTAEKPNRVTRSAVIMEDLTTGDYFAIWMVGTLKNFFTRVPSDAPVSLTYKGLADKAFKPNQSVPHIFDFALGKGVSLLSREEMETLARQNNNQAAGATAQA